MAERIELTFLGTGSAVPTKRRNHLGMLLKYKNENILIDCGEGMQRQFRKAGKNPQKITKILISHWHGDHVLGLPGLFMTMVMNGYNKNLEIYGPKGTKEKVRQYFDLIALKGQKLSAKVIEVENEVFFESEDFSLECLSLDHDTSCNGYSFVVKEKKRLDKKKLVVLGLSSSPLMAELAKGKVVEIDGKKVDGKKLIYVEPSRKVSFVLDTRMTENAVKISKRADLLVCESTYSAEEKEIAREYGHLTCEDAANIAKKAKVKDLVLVHLSQRYDEIPKMILEEAKKVFGEGIRVVEDFDKVVL